MFCWISAHKGIEGNEEADRLAKNASEFDEYEYRTPHSDLTSMFKAEEKRNIVLEIKKQADVNGREYLRNYYKETCHLWYRGTKFPRELISWVNRVRANHYHINASLSRIGIIDDPSWDRWPC